MDTPLFGQCYFAGEAAKAGLNLTDEVIAAGRAYMTATGVPRPPAIQAEEANYWGNMSLGTGESYNVPPNGAEGTWGA